jgi:hypothetical protein
MTITDQTVIAAIRAETLGRAVQQQLDILRIAVDWFPESGHPYRTACNNELCRIVKRLATEAFHQAGLALEEQGNTRLSLW